MMKDENAFTPTLCTALVSRDRWSKHAYQNASDPNASDLIAFCKFHSFLVVSKRMAAAHDACDACIIKTWRLRLRAPLVARSKVVKNIEIKIHIYAKRQK